VPADPPIEKPRSLAAAWVAIALLIAVLGGFKWKSGGDRAACILQTRNVQQATRSFQGINGLYPGDAFDRTALIGPGKFIESEPICPAGGTYTWCKVQPAIGTLTIRCSHRKHQLAPARIADW
jgi:hypothetical protein